MYRGAKEIGGSRLFMGTTIDGKRQGMGEVRDRDRNIRYIAEFRDDKLDFGWGKKFLEDGTIIEAPL